MYIHTSGASLDLGNIEGGLLLDFGRFLACQRVLLLDILVCLHLLFCGDSYIHIYYIYTLHIICMYIYIYVYTGP